MKMNEYLQNNINRKNDENIIIVVNIIAFSIEK